MSTSFDAARVRESLRSRVTSPARQFGREVLGAAAQVPPIVIFTMEKVGTQTVEQTLKDASPVQRVYMGHAVSGSGSRQLSRSVPIDQDQVRRRVGEGENLRVISAMRDPVARDISLFFELIPVLGLRELAVEEPDGLVPEFLKFVRNELSAAYLRPAEWAETELAALVGADLVSDLHQAPVQTHANDASSLLFFRAEDLDNTKVRREIAAFSGRQFDKLSDKNRSGSKAENPFFGHYKAYPNFKRDLLLSAEYLDSAYGDELVRRIYSEEELGRFREFWSNGRGI